MVNIMMGPEGSGKTKLLIGALNQAVQKESGSIVCMEKGDTLAMIIAGLITILPAAIVTLVILAAAGYFFIMR